MRKRTLILTLLAFGMVLTLITAVSTKPESPAAATPEDIDFGEFMAPAARTLCTSLIARSPRCTYMTTSCTSAKEIGERRTVRCGGRHPAASTRS